MAGAKKNNIKPLITYALQTNKPLLQLAIGQFNPAILVRDTNKIIAQLKYEYDLSGKLIQTTDARTNLSSSIIYGYNNTRAIAQISNAIATDVAYTSFEPNSQGGWEIAYYGSSGFDSLNATTGKYAFDLTNNGLTKTGLNATTTYLVTYWTKGNAYISGATTANVLQDERNGWSFYAQKITGFTTVTLYGNGLIDELRLHPINANMVTNTYEPFGEINSSNDANNNINYVEFDKINRPSILRDKDKNIVKKYEYSDTFSIIYQTPNWQLMDSVSHWFCERDSITGYFNGKVWAVEQDLNIYSETYLAQRSFFHHIDNNRCFYSTLNCTVYLSSGIINPAIRQVGAVCETGQKIYTASVYRKVVFSDGTSAFKWECTYHYLWTDAVTSINYTEIGDTSCPITSIEY